jgi:hypothetical protein
METDFIQPEPELILIIVPAPDDTALFSKEYQKVLLDLIQALKAEGLEVSSPISTFDAVGAVGGYSGQFIIASIAAFAAVIKSVQKLIETRLDARDGRKLKVQIGPFRMEGSARDVEKIFERLVSSEPFRKLLESETSKKKPRRSN